MNDITGDELGLLQRALKKRGGTLGPRDYPSKSRPLLESMSALDRDLFELLGPGVYKITEHGQHVSQRWERRQ